MNTNRRLTIFALLTVLFLALGIGTRLSIKAMSPVPTKLGVFFGYFKPCPETPNCVSSQSKRAENKIEPISFDGVSRTIAYQLLSEVIDSLPRAEILVSRVDYMHVEFRSFWLGFRDDAEFALNDTTRLIEVRSAARLGKDDGGANRKRVEEIRTEFTEKLRQVQKR